MIREKVFGISHGKTATKSLTPAEFTRQWHSRHTRDWIKYLGAMAGQPVHYLEIGVFEAASLVWMAENILTHPMSRGIGVDPWEYSRKVSIEEAHRRAMANTATYPQIEIVRAKSTDYLLGDPLPPRSLDIVYIDGGHNHPAPYLDSLLVWPLVKPGGIVIWDDYNNRANTVGVKQGVDRFLAGCEIVPTVLWCGHRQIAVRKRNTKKCQKDIGVQL